MKDRILFTIALLCIMLLMSCSGGGSGDGEDNPTDRTLTYYMDISMEATAGSQIIILNDLSTNVSSATSTAAWLTPTRRTYTSGAPSIMIEVTANTATSDRNCTSVRPTSDK